MCRLPPHLLWHHSLSHSHWPLSPRTGSKLLPTRPVTCDSVWELTEDCPRCPRSVASALARGPPNTVLVHHCTLAPWTPAMLGRPGRFAAVEPPERKLRCKDIRKLYSENLPRAMPMTSCFKVSWEACPKASVLETTYLNPCTWNAVGAD